MLKATRYSSDASSPKIVHPASFQLTTTTSLPNHHPVDLPNVNTPSLVNSHRHVENTVEVASILTSLEESTQPVESVMMGPSQLVEPHKQQQTSSPMGPPSDVNSATSINHNNNLLDSFTRQSSYYTTRDLLNILEAKSDRIGGGVRIFIRSGIEFSMVNNLLLNDTIIDLLGVNLKLNNTHDFGLKAEWHFFATFHGKSPCDGIGGTTKRLVARASLQASTKDQILNARDFYTYADAKINGIKFFWVDKKEIKDLLGMLEKDLGQQIK
ncbi:hypothetical protein HELRODRAFT_162697 [Helobdella robusta]|uniref:Uncharacterized protein n=1 Tax=Helobdella robusta TaxID=6412 RepID=T1ET09_HELRO|nr:hypothetical protein HELRODRAFT_162697 [Helobdella robusta]ESN99192.1 hypothetical protein HELRODRAFT_162697 [Helobdella robusta]